jgi:multiple sugar transport system permease protein
MAITKWVGRISLNLSLLLVALICIIPFWWVFVMSTLPGNERIMNAPMIPRGEFLINFQTLIETVNLGQSFMNSLYLATVTTLLSLFFSALASMAYAKYQFKYKQFLFMFTLLTMFMPSQLAWIGQIKQFQSWGILDTYWPFILGAFGAAFSIIVITGYIERGIPDSLLDSARMDGAREFFIFVNIVLPLIRPVLASLAIITFIGSWNNYAGVLVIIFSPEKYTLPLALSLLDQGVLWSNTSAQAVGILISLLPIMTVYFIASRQFIQALTSGAIKE